VEIECLRQARVERAGDDMIAHVAGGAPLTVRFAREGDRMRPFGMTGHKKLSDLFIDARIPRRERWRTPVVESGGEIVWVVGVAIGEGARVRAGNGEVIRLAASRDRMTV
jgi:tRNA(Ile)-lysidine synthase